MTTTTAILALLGGFVLLILGAEGLVRNASRLGLHYGLRPMIVGATIVAFSTSAPELLVSMLAAIAGQDDIALGNVVGSNIANIGLVLAAAAIIRPVTVRLSSVRLEYTIALFAAGGVYLMARDGVLDWRDGALLTGAFVLFMVVYLRVALRQRTDVIADASPSNGNGSSARVGLWWFLSLIGLGILLVGSHFVVEGASVLATNWGVAAGAIGATVIAVGTSLPEMATSIVAAIKGEHDIAVGNVLGSNIFNVLCVLGPTALVTPVVVSGADVDLYIPFMVGLTLLLSGLLLIGSRLSRLHGIVLLVAYGAFVWLRYR